MKRRIFIQGVLAAGLGMAMGAQAKSALPVIEVYKSATCGCCTAWAEHLQANGFTVKASNVPNPAQYREKFGIPNQLGSCHTGVVDGYAIEGHVPAQDIKRLLAERPKAKGLTVPGMPIGSPGMEVEGQGSDAYDVLLVHTNGNPSVFSRYEAKPAAEGKQAKGDAKSAMTDGEVRKVDKGAGKITIKHGPLVNLGMPAMTMVFRAQDPAMLNVVNAGDKIRFVAEKVKGAYTVVQMDIVR